MPCTREHTYSLGTEIKETKQNVNKKKRNNIYNNRIYRLNNGVRCIYNSEQYIFVLSPTREACPSVQASLETYTNENLRNQVPYYSSSATPLTICTTASLKPLKGPRMAHTAVILLSDGRRKLFLRGREYGKLRHSSAERIFVSAQSFYPVQKSKPGYQSY